MANIKITDLTAYTDPLNTDVLPIVDVTSDTTKKVSIADLLKNASAGTAAAPGIAFDGDSNTGIYRPGADQLALSTNGTGRINVEADGDINIDSGGVFYDASTKRLAIGTTSPSSLLHLNSNSTSAGNGGLRVATADSNESFLTVGVSTSLDTAFISSLQNGTGSARPLSFVVGTSSANERMRIDTSGRLLVGTSTTLGQGELVQIAKSDAGDHLGIFSFDATAQGQAAEINFSRSRSDTIGTGAVLAADDRIGTLNFRGWDGDNYSLAATIAAEADAEFNTSGDTTDSPGRLVFSTTADGASSPTERMRISEDGTIRSVRTYNNTTATAANMVVQADGQFSRSTSSAKYKTNIETLQDVYADAVLNCRPVWYRSTCDGDNPAHSWWGFIAEEVAEIDPRLVHWKTTDITYDENGSAVKTPCDPEPEGVAYDRFVPHLLNLIKRQQQAIETLEASNTDLLARVSALESA